MQNEGSDERLSVVNNEVLPAVDDNFASSTYAGKAAIVAASPPESQQFSETQQDEDDDDDDELMFNNGVQLHVTKAPPDNLKFVYFVFYLLGIGTMTPWNFFITADEYWMYKFRNVTAPDSHELTPMQRSFTCDMTLTASVSGTVFLIINAVYGHHMALRSKMLTTLGLILGLFIMTTAFVEVNTDDWQGGFFLLTLATVLIMNVSSAVLCGALFGAAGVFPSSYMSAAVSGQALGGILTALALIFVLLFDAAAITTAFIFFIVAIVLVLLCIVCFLFMERRPFFRHYLECGEHVTITYDDGPGSSEQTIASTVPLDPIVSEVFKTISPEAFGILLVFATTLSVYPAVTELMRSSDRTGNPTWTNVYYVPVVNYLLFNSGDYVGRMLAGYIEKPTSRSITYFLILLRIIFVPFFVCSNSDVHKYMPILVHSDAVFIAMMAVFAVSSGYLTNLLLINAPRAVKQHEKQVASAIMAACLSLGIAMGSALSMIIVQVL